MHTTAHSPTPYTPKQKMFIKAHASKCTIPCLRQSLRENLASFAPNENVTLCDVGEGWEKPLWSSISFSLFSSSRRWSHSSSSSQSSSSKPSSSSPSALLPALSKSPKALVDRPRPPICRRPGRGAFSLLFLSLFSLSLLENSR